MPRRARLRSATEIRRAFSRGRRQRAGPVDLFLSESTADRPRIAVVVPRHGRTLVERNRLRRRLREIVRREWLPGAHQRRIPLDAVVRARPDAYRATFEELEACLRRAFALGFGTEDPGRGAGRDG